MLDIAMDADIQLDANLGLINTSFGALMDLSPRTVLTIAAFNQDNIPLTVRGSETQVLAGKIGGQDGFKALRIQSPALAMLTR